LYKDFDLKKFVKILFVTAILIGGANWASYADRGLGKKKSKVQLNIMTQNKNLKGSLAFNLKTGLKYTGTLLDVKNENGKVVSSSLVTYQKGNSVYILPYKTKKLVPENRAGYAGVKLTIKP
jgi:hypothetical protein